MNKWHLVLPVVIFACSYFACTEIFEEDISDREIYLLSPADTVRDHQKVTFWWDPIANAGFYELQVVSPNFENINLLVVDTIITTNKLTISIEKGEYEWCVRGYNSVYSTNFMCRDLVVQISSHVVTVPYPTLEFPKQDSVVTSFPLTLSWIRGEADIVGDSLYIYDAENLAVQGFPLFTRQTNFTIDNLPPGKFTWSVASMDADGNISEINDENIWTFEIPE